MVTILVANVYGMAVTAEKCQIYSEIRDCYKGLFYLQNSVLTRSILFKCIFVFLLRACMQGINKQKILLSLYISFLPFEILNYKSQLE